MHWPLFVARHLSAKKQKSFSKTVVRLAIVAVALSVAFMILAVATVRGFQNAIKNKVIGVNGHVLVHHPANDKGSEPLLLDKNAYLLTPQLQKIAAKFQGKVFPIIQKPGILKGETELEGVVIKGVDDDFNYQFMSQHLIKGRLPIGINKAKEAIISKTTADRLGLDTGNSLKVIFFVDNEDGQKIAKAIAPQIVGIYSTGIDEFDKSLVLTHRKQLYKLLSDTSQISSWECYLPRFQLADSLSYALSNILDPQKYLAETVNKYHPEIFDWLEILDTNIIIILALMTLVAAITMCTTLLILVTNRANMVGILKAMGARNGKIKQIFIYQATAIASVGLLIGNIIALTLGTLQNGFGFLKLPEEIYYLDQVVLDFNLITLLWINLGTLLICALVLYLPATIITKLSPVKTIRFN